MRDGTPALSDITLSWMIDKASGLGLEIDPVAKAKYASPLDSKYASTELHTSFSGPPAFLSWTLRVTPDKRSRCIIPQVSSAAFFLAYRA